MEVYYIHTLITPILTYLRSSLKSSLRKPSNLKAIQKMISLKSGVKMGLMKKLLTILVLGLSNLTLTTSANAASSVGIYKIFNSIKLFIFGEKVLEDGFSINWKIIAFIIVVIILAIIAYYYDTKEELKEKSIKDSEDKNK